MIVSYFEESSQFLILLHNHDFSLHFLMLSNKFDTLNLAELDELLLNYIKTNLLLHDNISSTFYEFSTGPVRQHGLSTSWSNKDIDNRLPYIMSRLPSIGVTKISTKDYLP